MPSGAGARTAATLADLRRYDGKAELIGGTIVPLMPTGFRPNQVAGRIFRRLPDHVDALGPGQGVAFTDNMGFAVPELPSGRESFSPDVAYYHGPLPADEMDFIDGPPTFAVEVRSKGDYGAAAEVEKAAKRLDYFLAGTLVVWDVDPRAQMIRVYRAGAGGDSTPVVFERGGHVDAEPAVPGWRMALDEVFA